MTTSTIARARSGPTAQVRGGWKRLVALSVLAMLVMTAFAGVFGASSANAAEEDQGKFSFYKVTSLLSAMTSNALAPDAPDGDIANFRAQWADGGGIATKAGTAGALLSYADPAFFDLKGWGMAGLSMASTNVSYDKLRVYSAEGEVQTANKQGMLGYAYYGKALSDLGLDEAKTGGGFDVLRPVGGGLMLAVFSMSWAVDEMFNFAIDTLKFLNPFRLFADALNTNVKNAIGSENPVFAGLAAFVGDLYKVVSSLAWGVLVPLFIGVFAVGIVMFRKMDKGGATKKLIVRIAFIGLGIPLLGMLYTTTLNQMSGDGTPRESASSSVIASTYVDFGAWAERSRLLPPNGGLIQVNPENGDVTPQSHMNVRQIARSVNKMAHPVAFEHLSTGSQNEMDSALSDMSESASGSGPLVSMGISLNMLTGYMTGSQVASSGFESAFANELDDLMEKGGDRTVVAGWFEKITTQDEKSILEDTTTAASSGGNPLLSVSTPLTMSSRGVFTAENASIRCYYKVGDNSNCAMSPVGIYNYLNTSFDGNSMTMYSSSKASSDLVRKSHMEVNLVGTGVMSLLYWTNSFVLLASFVVIGLAYVVALIFASVRRTFNLVGSVPFALMGFMGGIAKTIVYTVALIAEVLLTIGAYMLIQQFLKGLPAIIEMPLAFLFSSTGTSSGVGNALMAAGPVVPMISTLFSIIVIIAFTVIALKVRKGLVKAIEEASAKIINKFLDTGVGAGSGGGGMAPALAGGLAAGAGAAAANKMMGGPSAGGSGGSSDQSAMPGGIGVGADTAGDPSGDGAQTAIEANQDQRALEEGASTSVDGSSAEDGDNVTDQGTSMETSEANVDGSSSELQGDAADRAEAERVRESGLPQANPDAGPQGEGRSDAQGANGDGGPEKGVQASDSGPDRGEGAAAAAAVPVAARGLGKQGEGENPGQRGEQQEKGLRQGQRKPSTEGPGNRADALRKEGQQRPGGRAVDGRPEGTRQQQAQRSMEQAQQKRVQEHQRQQGQAGQQGRPQPQQPGQSRGANVDARSTSNVQAPQAQAPRQGGPSKGLFADRDTRASASTAAAMSTASAVQAEMARRAADRAKARKDLTSN